MTSMWILVVCFLAYMSAVRATFRLSGSYGSPKRLMSVGGHRSKAVQPLRDVTSNRERSAGQIISGPQDSNTFD
ncbi:hypothetical protein Pst134EA_019306 [Puccinia striiformis f. sp. tritici]|uniref:Secreted protein n=2 Tax=Puccinia striiformis TaxID=27350 RepID=A0A0L0V3Y8_9BASI|nr:hypothetical protein Pst134EA_019306 [Puccinia striiformis f. sp. tritici]KAH9459151.1 hypothetical protein Pst134EA_019306 [Puccinia striiformis f. sp. tritici]KAI9623524.1 hypothetical protein KEM48_009419 [Puccinia striiformis f. sp. tritici PST-130]KNE93704.1 hypothetical protein PSTG_12985 [Puccinia striiformis f. sp. tritici PST-78]POW16475.1 hypothetical protein PSTT_01301 [Puccinia striiformis]